MINFEVYKTELEKIYQRAREYGIPEAKIDKALQNSFYVIEKRNMKFNAIFYIKCLIAIFFATVLCLVSFDRKFLAVVLQRNLQNFIYPGLKLLRKIAVPIVNHYPPLSELYDEWCILENPYFYINDMDCWPCSVVHFVPDLTTHPITRSFNPGIPYLKTENLSEVHLENIRQLFWQNSEVLEKDAMKVFSNNLTYSKIQDVVDHKMDLNPSKDLDNHITWRINRITAGRILRKLFPKPADTPNWWEQSIEKFIFLDESKSPPYALPNPECSNVMIRCTTGMRLIKMIPSSECAASCESHTVLLSPGKILWYNWWYWRPVSLPALNLTSITISYMTSFC